MLPPIYAVLVTEGGKTKVWSTAPRSLEDADVAARACAAANPHKRWWPATYGVTAITIGASYGKDVAGA